MNTQVISSIEELARTQSNTSTASLQWNDVQELPSIRSEAPALPASMVPDGFRDWVTDVAGRLSVSLEAVAVPAMVAASAALGRKVGIHPKRQDDWIEMPILWGGLVAPPGAKKSACIDAATFPLERIQKKLSEEWKVHAAEVKADQTIKKKEKDLLDAQIGEAIKSGDTDLGALRSKLADAERALDAIPKTSRRVLVNDSTIEALQMTLVENPQGVLYQCDELTGLLSRLEREEQREARAFLLTAYGGKNGFRARRVGRGELEIQAAAVGILGGIQPEPLTKLFSEQIRHGNAGDGLFSRFLCSVWPEVPEFIPVDRPPNGAAAERAQWIFERLFDSAIAGPTWLESGTPFGLRFSPDAQSVFDRFQLELNRRLRAKDGESEAFQAWLAKTEGLMPRLALLFHLIDCSGGLGGLPEVSSSAAALAANWVEFLEQHARKIYGGTIQPALLPAHALARRIREGKIRDGITVSEIHSSDWQHLDKAPLVEAGLGVLDRHGWARVVTSIPTAAGGRPARVIRINPAILRKEGLS